MLYFTLDYSIFSEFVRSEPKGVLENSEDEISLWRAFWSFIKSGSNLNIVNLPVNLPELEASYYRLLTTGRGDSTITISDKFNQPHRFQFPKDTPGNSVYFIDETLENVVKYRKRNDFIFALKEDYRDVFSKMALLNSKKYPDEISVRKNASVGLKNWEQLLEYIISFSDVVISDNYLLSDKALMESNLVRIVELLTKAKGRSINLIVLSFEGDKAEERLYCESEIEYLRSSLKKRGVESKISIALSTRRLKEHDRGIFTNYLRFTSGDTFNFFLSSGELATKGTDVFISSYCYPHKAQVAETALKSIRKIIEESDLDHKLGEFNTALLPD